MRTLRSKRLRAALWRSTDGRCAICGCELPEDWHADHIEPWSKTGRTNVHEMQPLCPGCNIRKGGGGVRLREHQQALQSYLKKVVLRPGKPAPTILSYVVPGGGKSMLPAILARALPQLKIAWFVPRVSLRDQAAKDALRDYGIELRVSGNETDPSHGSRGFVATHAALMADTALWADELRRRPYALVVDESHHAKIDPVTEEPTPLSKALRRLYPLAALRLDMSGTLETNDRQLICGLAYDSNLVPDPESGHDHFIRYSRVQALLEGALVPVIFHHHDGEVRWRDILGDEPVSRRLSQANGDDAGKALFTALETDLAEQLLREGFRHWREMNAGKLIVVAARQEHAARFAETLRSWGEHASLAIDDNDEAHLHIARFRDDYKDGDATRALVTCQMAYEGLDVRSASHLICLTHIRSKPWIEQMLGRVWRKDAGKDRCFAFVPDDARMNEVIDRIRSEEIEAARIREKVKREAPGARGTVTPLNSRLDDVRESALDGEVDQAVQNAGYADAAAAAALLSRQEKVRLLASLQRDLEDGLEAPLLTVREREQELRDALKALARSCDALEAKKEGRPPCFGDANRWLYSRMGKGVGDMSVEELQQALKELRGRYALIQSR